MLVVHFFGNLYCVEGIVYLLSGVEQCLAVVHQRYFFLGLAHFQIGHELSVIENRHCKLSESRKQPAGWIADSLSEAVGPSCAAGKADFRVEGRPCLVGAVV